MFCINDPTLLSTAGGYNHKYKHGFELNIQKCQKNCKSEEEIESFIKNLFMFGYMPS